MHAEIRGRLAAGEQNEGRGSDAESVDHVGNDAGLRKTGSRSLASSSCAGNETGPPSCSCCRAAGDRDSIPAYGIDPWGGRFPALRRSQRSRGGRPLARTPESHPPR